MLIKNKSLATPVALNSLNTNVLIGLTQPLGKLVFDALKRTVIANQAAASSALRAAFGGCALDAISGRSGVATEGSACGAIPQLFRPLT